MGFFHTSNICTPHTTSKPSTSGGEKMVSELELLLELALLVSHNMGVLGTKLMSYGRAVCIFIPQAISPAL